MNLKRCDFLKAPLAPILLALAGIAPGSVSQSASPSAGESIDDQIVMTKRQAMVGGRVLRYTARAGRLPILDNETGEVHGRIFFTAYTLDSALNQSPRP